MHRVWRTGGSANKVNEVTWKPQVTVAAHCERDGRYLLVRELIDGREVYNQPAGHLDPGESLIEAAIRETLEETRYHFSPTAVVGIYRYPLPQSGDTTFLRFLFRGEVSGPDGGALDQDIIAAEWLTYDAVLACRDWHRTPMVLQCIEDARAGRAFPLETFSREFA